MRSRPLVVGLGVLAVGFCAALPFRRPAAPDISRQLPADDLELQWRSVPLDMAVRSDHSPAIELYDREREVRRPASLTADPQPPRALPDLHPPAMEERYRPQQLAADAPPRQPPAPPVPRTHRLANGDTLPQLAERYLGDKQRFREIFAANRDVLSDPNLLPIGEQLVIPPR